MKHVFTQFRCLRLLIHRFSQLPGLVYLLIRTHWSTHNSFPTLHHDNLHWIRFPLPFYTFWHICFDISFSFINFISWYDNWAMLSTYFKYLEAIRHLIYTTKFCILRLWQGQNPENWLCTCLWKFCFKFTAHPLRIRTSLQILPHHMFPKRSECLDVANQQIKTILLPNLHDYYILLQNQFLYSNSVILFQSLHLLIQILYRYHSNQHLECKWYYLIQICLTYRLIRLNSVLQLKCIISSQ